MDRYIDNDLPYNNVDGEDNEDHGLDPLEAEGVAKLVPEI